MVLKNKGVLKERVEYHLIRQMKETKNPISSAAMSLDRLQIDYMEKGYHQTVLISPVRKKEFIEKLEQYRRYQLANICKRVYT